MQVSGTITKILDIQKGQTKDGNEWQKQSYILDSKAEYNNIYCFEVFGEEKVQNLTKYNKVGDEVEVEFNVNTNEYQGKYYTTLSSWKITKTAKNSVSNPQAFETIAPENVNEEANDDLPF